MPHWLKIILKIIGGICVLLLLISLGAAWYISTHKKELMRKITAELSEEINGTLTIEDIAPELIRGFPAISASLKNVVLRDSLYSTHKHDLLKADNVYVSVDAFSLLHTPRIRTVEISNGSLYLFTDSVGYSNTGILSKKDSSSKKKKPKIDHIYMRSVAFVFENKFKAKFFRLNIHDMETELDYNSSGWSADTDLSALVNDFCFNTAKGSYMKNKELSMKIVLQYNQHRKTLAVARQTIQIGGDDLNIGGEFDFSQSPGAFTLNISSNSILFGNAASLLSPNISSKLAAINLKEPVNASASIRGHMKFRDTPLVYVTVKTRDNTLTTPGGQIKNMSFTGVFQNRYYASLGYKDDNSHISIYRVNGTWENIPFVADSIQVHNLIKPFIEGHFSAHFPLERLNPVIGANTFNIKSGTADLRVFYRGGLLSTDTTASYVLGTVQVSNASIIYLPRHMEFTNTNASVTFNGSDVFIENAKVQCGSTLLSMNGSIRNFMSLYYTNPDKLLLDWTIYSRRIDVDEFLSFLAVRQSAAAITPPTTGGNRTVAHISQQMDNVLAASNVHMRLQVDKLLHKDFVADDISADIHMEQKKIVLNNVGFDNSGGHIDLRGYIEQEGQTNNFHLFAGVINVRIPEFFKSFGNFGQDAITDKNLMGRLYARTDITGSMRDSGRIIPYSLNGKVDFEINDGALINFGPFLKVSKYVFRRRDLGNVRFNILKNTLEIKGDKIYINPMMIESSAINLKAGGVYSLTTGTDIDIDIPLRNPKNDELILDDSLRMERNMKGIVIHLNAVDGDDGSVKIKLRLGKKKEQADPGGIDTPEKPRKKGLLKRILSR